MCVKPKKVKADKRYLGQILRDDVAVKPGHDEESHSQMSGPVICDLPCQQVSLVQDWELVFCDVLSGVKEMVAAQRAADGQRTRPPLPLWAFMCLYIKHS